MLLACMPVPHANAAGNLVPTEFRVTGDDGLTTRFAQAVTEALEESTVLAKPTSWSSERIVLGIPANLYWQDARGQTNFQYVVIFTDQSVDTLALTGGCWERGMAGCALTAVKEAERA